MASKKLDDCYFYYYSTCYKGDDCPFRHEELALGCETVCNNWKTGNCQNRNCQFRHMLLKKNRKAIPCFWESQPDGCRKPHCPFLHKKGKPDSNSKDPAKSSGIINQSSSGSMMANNIPVESSSSHIVSDGGLRRPNMSTLENDLNFASPPVDPLVVKFEEESDNELDIPSPCKSVAVQSQKKSWVKTLEEIRLEKIQKLSAAFYSFAETANDDQEPGDVMMDVLDKAIVTDLSALTKTNNRSLVKSTVKRKASEDDSLGFKVMTLAEIRQKRQKKNQVQEPDSTSESDRSVVPGEEDILKDKASSSSADTDCSIHRGTISHQVNISSHLRVTSVARPQVDAPGKLKTSPLLSSTASDVPQVKYPAASPLQPSMEDVDVPQVNKITSLQKVPLCTEDTKLPLKMSTSTKMSSPLHESTDCPSMVFPQKSSSQKVPKCSEDENVDFNQKSVKITIPQKVQMSKVSEVIVPQKDLPCASSLSTEVVEDQKPITMPSPLHQDAPQNQQNADAPQKKKPIRLKRGMRRDTQDEPDQAASCAKRPKNSEDDQPSLSLNSSRSDETELNLEITSNQGEMDTDDILNGIDELLGN